MNNSTISVRLGSMIARVEAFCWKTKLEVLFAIRYLHRILYSLIDLRLEISFRKLLKGCHQALFLQWRSWTDSIVRNHQYQSSRWIQSQDQDQPHDDFLHPIRSTKIHLNMSIHPNLPLCAPVHPDTPKQPPILSTYSKALFCRDNIYGVMTSTCVHWVCLSLISLSTFGLANTGGKGSRCETGVAVHKV